MYPPDLTKIQPKMGFYPKPGVFTWFMCGSAALHVSMPITALKIT